MPPAPTLEAIATRAGVTKMTVSRVIRNHPSVAPATRERVLKAVTELGYRRDPLVAAHMAAIRRGRPVTDACTLAYISGFSREEARFTPWARRFIEGAQRRATALGYGLEIFWPEATIPHQRLGEILLARGIPGVILGLFPRPQETVDLPWAHFASVAIGYNVASPALHRVENDQIDLFLQLCSRLGDWATAHRPSDGRRLGKPGARARKDGISVSSPTDPRSGRIRSSSRGPGARRLSENGSRAGVRMVVICKQLEIVDWLQRSACAFRMMSATSAMICTTPSRTSRGLSGLRERRGWRRGSGRGAATPQRTRRPCAAKLMLVSGEWHEGTTIRPQ
jgi:hypothetical protein